MNTPRAWITAESATIKAEQNREHEENEECTECGAASYGRQWCEECEKEYS